MNYTTTNFHDTMLKKLGKRKTRRITEQVTDLLRSWVNLDPNGDMIWAADYCNAFGVMQGVAYQDEFGQ